MRESRANSRTAALALCLASALALAQSARVVLRWKPVAGAASYELQIARDERFTQLVLQQKLQEPVYRWEELPNVSYFWRVRSFDADGRPSQWSAARAIRAAATAPTLAGPADDATVTCRFEGVDFAAEPQAVFKDYLLEVSEDPALETGVQSQRSPGAKFRVVLAPGAWTWRMKAVDLQDRFSEATAPRRLTVALAAPKPKATADQGVGQGDVALGWGDVPCATRYQVEAALEGQEPVQLAAGGTQAGFAARQAGEYRWRVAAVDSRGTTGPFSAWTTFRVRLPAPAAKADAVGADATLTWAPAAQAAGYRVEVAASPDFKPLVASGSAQGTAWKPGALPPGQYLWRVFAKDAAGRFSLPSEVRKLTVPDPVPPDAPEVLTPTEGWAVRKGEGPLEVSWSEAKGAARYDVQVDDGPIFETPGTTRTLGTLPDGNHVVRVRARGPGGTASPWSPPRSFVVGFPPPSRSRVDPGTLQAGGAALELVVRLFDESGAPAQAALPEVQASAGTLGPLRRRDVGVFEAAYTPPARGSGVYEVTFTVASAPLREEHRVPVERAPASVAAHVGGRFNGGAVRSPTADVGAAWRLPWWQRRVTLDARVGVYTAGASATLADGTPLAAAAQLIPVSLLAGYGLEHWGFLFRLQAGLAVQFATLQVDGEGLFAAVPGVLATFTVGWPLGPGDLELQLDFLYGRLSGPALLHAGGFSFALGYRIDLFAGR